MEEQHFLSKRKFYNILKYRQKLFSETRFKPFVISNKSTYYAQEGGI